MTIEEIEKYIQDRTEETYFFQDTISGCMGQVSLQVIRIMVSLREKFNLEFMFSRSSDGPDDNWDRKFVQSSDGNLFVRVLFDGDFCDLTDFWNEVDYQFKLQSSKKNPIMSKVLDDLRSLSV